MDLKNVIVVIDPGHGGTDPGAVGNGLKESAINLIVSLKVRDKLRARGFTVVMTRETDVFVELQRRCDISDGAHAIIFVSIHTNAGGGRGAEVLCYLTGGKGQYLAQCIANEVCGIMGIHGTPLKDGSRLYVVNSTDAPACLVELGFIDTASDAEKIKNNYDNLANAIYKGICTNFGVNPVVPTTTTTTTTTPVVTPPPVVVPTKPSLFGFPLPVSANPSVAYQAHVQNVGWQNLVADGDMVGTVGESLRLEGLRIELENVPQGASIKYQAHIENIGWANEVRNGALAGTQGKSYRLEAIKVTLENLPNYSVQYQAHVQNIGWQNWVKDGEVAGTTGQSLRLEALRIKLVKK